MVSMSSKEENQSLWLPYFKGNRRAKLSLFCFPHSGAGASVYLDWEQYLPSEIELIPVQLPGRENRISEEPFTEMETLIDDLSAGLKPYLQRPFAFFGHSMGALVSYELTKRIREKFNLGPEILIVSGINAPHLPRQRSAIHHLPDDRFLAEIDELNGTAQEVLENRELLSLLLPTLRADFKLCDTYIYLDEGQIDCPIAAFNGLQDRYISREGTDAWRNLTTAPFSIRMFPGDHFYLNSGRVLFLKMLLRELHPILI